MRMRDSQIAEIVTQ